MRKKSALLVITMLLCAFVFAQQREETTEEKVGKYTVKLVTNEDNTFGYSIYLEDKLVEKQTSKPYFSLSPGFTHKKSAMVVGKWYATELNEGRSNKYALSLV